jgi:hypothetical protein
MTDYEPIDYRLRCHSKRTDLPPDVLRDICEAYEAIERLTKERDEIQRELRRAETESSMLRVECGVIAKERDEARREVCFLLSRNVTQGCDGDTPEFHATARGWCYLLEEDDE